VPYTAKVIEILIASPGDVKEEREAAWEIVLDWNRKYTRRHKIVLLPRMWELDATPQLGSDPQAAVNEQLVETTDILVGILWTRLGTPTPRSRSGTVEEITKFLDSKRPGILYFSSRQTDPHIIDFSQFQAVKDFRSEIRNKALCGQFSDLEDFKKQFSDHLDNTVHRYFRGAEDDQEASIVAPQTRVPQIGGKALCILKAVAQAPDRRLTRMRQAQGVVVISCGQRIFNTPGDHRSTVAWESAINELLQNDFCKELSEGRLYEITDAGYQYVEEVARQEFAEGQHVLIAATIEESWGNSDQKTTKDYVVRVPRGFLEGKGIEWDYDFLLRDRNFVSQLVSKISEISSESMLSGSNWRPISYSVPKCEFYRGDLNSLPEPYHQVSDNCLVWEMPS
jgi:hypothetical protein